MIISIAVGLTLCLVVLTIFRYGAIPFFRLATRKGWMR